MNEVTETSAVVGRAAVFAALGDTTRLRLVVKLSGGGERSISQLTGGTGLTRQAVTKHLRVMQDAGLVRSQKSGREQRFTLVPETLVKTQSFLETVSSNWDDALGRLKAHLEVNSSED